ncbi:MAG: site-2 protease family protein, partial [Pseudomonadota bacterium]
HIDLIGTILVPITLLALSNLFGGGFIFGWAKPVPVTWRNLKNPRRDIALVALAGPGANLAMAIGWMIVLLIGIKIGDSGSFLQYVGGAGITINILLMVLNLLPILPLDGGRVLYTFLPSHMAYNYARSEPYGFFILLFLLMTGALGFILTPLLLGAWRLVSIIAS